MSQRKFRSTWAILVVAAAGERVVAQQLQVTESQQTLNVSQTQYDGEGRYSQTVDPLTSVTTTVYDSQGSDANVTPLYTYDDDSRIVQGPGPTYQYDDQGSVPSATPSAYDDAGNQIVTQTDSQGGRANYDDSPSSGLTQQTDPLGRVTTYTYDPNYGVTGVDLSDPIGNRTTFVYDPAGNRIQTTDGLSVDAAHGSASESGTVDFTPLTQTYYDAQGNITVMDAGSSLTVTLYDATTNTTVFQYDTSDSISVGTTQYQYDAGLEPLAGLTGSLTGPLNAGNQYVYSYSLDLTSSDDANLIGSASGSLDLTAVPLPPAASAGLALLALAAAKRVLHRRRSSAAAVVESTRY